MLTKWFDRSVAMLAIYGGGVGIIDALMQVQGLTQVSRIIPLGFHEYFLVLLPFLFSLLSLFCGVLLLEGASGKTLLLNKIFFLIQVPVMHNSIVTYYAFSGINLEFFFQFPFRFSYDNFTFDFSKSYLDYGYSVHLGYNFSLKYLLDGVNFVSIGCNLVALGIFIYLLKHKQYNFKK